MPKIIEVLEYFDNTGNTMVKRMPEIDADTEIKWGAQLTVRESQKAIFFKDGKIFDVFDAGRYVLDTKNIPLLTKFLTSFVYGETSPFRAEVYFVNMKLFPNLKWGTPEPILFEDEKLQMVRLRSNGIYSIQISDPVLFLTKIVGTQGLYNQNEIANYLRNIIASKLAIVLGEESKSIFDLPKNYGSISNEVRSRVADEFKGLGLSIIDLLINSITLPTEVQNSIDARSGMSALGNLDEFLKFQMAKSIDNPSTNSNAGVGLGTGLGMGLILPKMLQNILSNKSDISSSKEELFDLITKLKELFDKGAITQEEFDEAKKQILSKL
jgi:membrane protease subunit (stomatin/prohibitin family)